MLFGVALFYWLNCFYEISYILSLFLILLLYVYFVLEIEDAKHVIIYCFSFFLNLKKLAKTKINKGKYRKKHTGCENKMRKKSKNED